MTTQGQGVVFVGLEERLAAAEKLCYLFGWSPSRALGRDATPIEKAAHEAWVTWWDLIGARLEGDVRQTLDAEIPVLAARRDAKRAETLAAMYGPEDVA